MVRPFSRARGNNDESYAFLVCCITNQSSRWESNETDSVDVSFLSWVPALIAHRHRPVAFSQRASSRGAFIRSAQAANAGVKPWQWDSTKWLISGLRRVPAELISSRQAKVRNALTCDQRPVDA